MQSDSSDVLLFTFLVFALWFPTVRGIAPSPPKATKGMQGEFAANDPPLRPKALQ